MENLKNEPVSILAKRLIRAGEILVSGENQKELDTYFDITHFQFHGPGYDTDYNGLISFFKAMRDAFAPLTIKRGLVIQESNFIACQTYIEGRFVNEFTQSPVGAIPPNGENIVFDLMNIFKFDNEGRLIEEWVRMDNRELLVQLGVK